MTLNLKQQGRFYVLPIIGLAINKIQYDGMITLYFNDKENSNLQIHSDLKVTRFNQTTGLSPRSKECLILLYEHFGLTIKEAKADKGGNLWISFDNGTEITIEDGPFENWHYTKNNPENRKDSLYVHGGIGKTGF